MKNKLLSIGLMIIFISLGMLKDTIEIELNSIDDYKKLIELGIELDHHRTIKSVHAYATNDEIQLLNYHGFKVKKIINKAYQYYQELKRASSHNPFEEYHDYNELTSFLNNITSEYPDITLLTSIGQSVEGRELWVMEITDNPGINEVEPEFKYIANMHGDETVGRELSLYLIEWLVNNYNIDQRATDLVNNTAIFIMPSMNPDGFENGSRYNSNGVDLNRDFPDQFNDPNNTIIGRQPETAAVMEWSSNKNFILSANMHTGALVVNYPFDGPSTGSYSACPDDQLFIDLSLTYADAHPNMESGGFNNGITNGAQWYALYGGMQDWNYIWNQNFDITLEQNEVKWPNSNQLPALWNEHKEPMLAYMERIHDGVRGLVVDANSGEPVNASILIEGINHTIYPDIQNGDYYRILSPGNYTMTVQAFGYISQSESITIPLNGYIEINFLLNKDPWLETAIIEDFEQGDLTNFNWILEGDSNWYVDNSQFFEGNYSIKAGEIAENEQTSLSIELNLSENSQIAFYKKVSCESTGIVTGNYYDYLSFYIDNIEQNKWAGEIDWSLEQYNISSGLHTLTWKYMKDGGVDSGLDTAWLDFIIFPSSNNNILGDINNDGLINIIDVVQLVDIIINNESIIEADLNNDNIINVLDIIALINIILN